MKFLRNHWYDLGLIPLGLTLLYLFLHWQALDVLQRLAWLNFAVIWWHQFEEYRFPGGEPAITNLATQPTADGPSDRYPLNQNNAMVMNVTASLVFYLLPVVFPRQIWLDLAPVTFGLAQAIIHVGITPRQIGNHLYSPGACAVVLGHVPVGIYWYYVAFSQGLLTWLQVLAGIAYLAVFIRGFMMGVGYGLLKSPESPYPFPKEEFERGGYAARIRRRTGEKQQA